METVGVIPARLGSTRLARKVLMDLGGKPVIQHVYERTRKARLLDDVIVACDDDEIVSVVRGFGGKAVLTSKHHTTGTDRLAEVVNDLDVKIIVNIQGDEPEIDPVVVDSVVALAKRSGAEVTTLASPFHEGEDPADPNAVKVVLRQDGNAMYFSRALLPFARVGGDQRTRPLRHIGLYVYRAGFLRTYAALPPTPCERSEMLEQLRVLEHGHRIAVAVHDCRGQGIDTPEQYEAFVARVLSQRSPNRPAKSRQKVG